MATESFDGNFKNEIIFFKGKALKITTIKNGITQVRLIANPNDSVSDNSQTSNYSNGISQTQILPTKKPDPVVDNMLPDVTVIAYTGGGSYSFTSLYFITNQNPVYYFGYTPSGGGGGGGNPVGPNPSTPSNDAYVPIYQAPLQPIKDIVNELKCFTVDSTAIYTVTLNVNQPIPGTRNIVNPFTTHTVGHTYLTLEQDNANGSQVIRNVGFYPKTGAKPGKTVDTSIFGDDATTPADITLTIVITGQEMQGLRQAIINESTLNYDLSNFNCTTAAIHSLDMIGIALPETVHTEPGLGNTLIDPNGPILFKGLNPGDLGEDIRSLDEVTFSAQNGNKVVTIIRRNSNELTPPAKTGICSN